MELLPQKYDWPVKGTSSSNLDYFLFYFITFAIKQTNKQTERTLAGKPQQLWPITAGPDSVDKVRFTLRIRSRVIFFFKWPLINTYTMKTATDSVACSGLYGIRTLYLGDIQRPAPSWLVSLIGRALHRYRRGQGFKSRTSLNFFFTLSFRNCKSWVYNCDDHPSFNSSLHSAVHICDFHIFITSS